MNDLISREKLIDYLYENNVRADISIEDLADEIFAEPKVGRWIRAEGELICSICEYPAEFNPLSSDFIETNYCPNCGVKMERSE